MDNDQTEYPHIFHMEYELSCKGGISSLTMVELLDTEHNMRHWLRCDTSHQSKARVAIVVDRYHSQKVHRLVTIYVNVNIICVDRGWIPIVGSCS